MKFFDINAFFKKAAQAQIRYRGAILAVTAALTAFFLAGLFKFSTIL